MYRAGTSLRSAAAISVCSRLKGLGSGAAPRSAHASSRKYPKRDEFGRALRSDTMRLSKPLPRKKRKKAASASDSGAAMAGGSAADGSAAGSSAADGSAAGGSAVGGLAACGAAGGLSFRVICLEHKDLRLWGSRREQRVGRQRCPSGRRLWQLHG